MERQMTPRQVAEATGMTYQNVCRLMRSGEIESFAVGVDPRSPRPRDHPSQKLGQCRSSLVQGAL